jgi:hypothetical protein
MEHHNILDLIVAGFWQGVGVEFSFFMLWMGWRVLHSKVAHRLDPEHIVHKIHDYFQ